MRTFTFQNTDRLIPRLMTPSIVPASYLGSARCQFIALATTTA